MSDLETLLRARQDAIRGGPKPTPTRRERLAGGLEWIGDRAPEMALYCAAAACALAALARVVVLLGGTR
jgi:hypothetical protein